MEFADTAKFDETPAHRICYHLQDTSVPAFDRGPPCVVSRRRGGRKMSSAPCEIGEFDEQIVGMSEQVTRLKRRLPAIARAQRTTLITGPTGAGKDVVARSLHAQSARRELAVRPGALRGATGHAGRSRDVRSRARRLHGRDTRPPRARPHRCERYAFSSTRSTRCPPARRPSCSGSSRRASIDRSDPIGSSAPTRGCSLATSKT